VRQDILLFLFEFSTRLRYPTGGIASSVARDPGDAGGMAPKRSQQTCDHRLVLLVQGIRDPSIATRLGVPRSTVAGWLRRAPRAVTAAGDADDAVADLRRRVARLERRCRRLVAVPRVAADPLDAGVAPRASRSR
jgi:hypothetical protein